MHGKHLMELTNSTCHLTLYTQVENFVNCFTYSFYHLNVYIEKWAEKNYPPRYVLMFFLCIVAADACLLNCLVFW